jgi:hypothetical protein
MRMLSLSRAGYEWRRCGFEMDEKVREVKLRTVNIDLPAGTAKPGIQHRRKVTLVEGRNWSIGMG